jgi:nucleoside-diphosphate-sugar epimerase
MNNTKNILITGGLGFIGAHSIEKWKNEGWEITVIDNLSKILQRLIGKLFQNLISFYTWHPP